MLLFKSIRPHFWNFFSSLRKSVFTEKPLKQPSPFPVSFANLALNDLWELLSEHPAFKTVRNIYSLGEWQANHEVLLCRFRVLSCWQKNTAWRSKGVLNSIASSMSLKDYGAAKRCSYGGRQIRPTTPCWSSSSSRASTSKKVKSTWSCFEDSGGVCRHTRITNRTPRWWRCSSVRSAKEQLRVTLGSVTVIWMFRVWFFRGFVLVRVCFLLFSWFWLWFVYIGDDTTVRNEVIYRGS